jgi:hypothetical protein
MAKELPAPGYYRSGDQDVIVLDPFTISDTGEVVTKDGDDARWQAAVVFKPAFASGPTRVLSAAVFDHRFKPTTQDDALARVQAAEMMRDKAAGDEARAAETDDKDIHVIEEGGTNGTAAAEGPTSEATA